ncbi:MAG: flagellar motor protein MotB [Planctomycetota bacterium]
MNRDLASRTNVARARARVTTLAVALALGTLASCVSQRQYDDAVALARYHQTSLHEKEKDLARAQTENERLKRQLAQNDVSALSAGYGDDIDSRLSELQGRIDNLGRPLKDIERFDVEGGYVLMVQDKILFESGSDSISAEGRTALKEVAGEINARPHGRIWVRGHTDSDPVAKPATKEKFPHGNLQLSAMRAVNVAAELSSSGKVPARDVVVVGFGQHDPVKANSSSDNKRLNRRVEIFVSDQAGPQATPASSPASGSAGGSL